MKKSLLLVAASAFLSVQGFAQITLVDADFGTVVNSTDRAIRTHGNSFNAVVGPNHINQARPTGYTWDINALYPGDSLTTGPVYYRHMATTGYEYGDSTTDGFGITYKYPTKILTDITASGIYQHGERITRKLYSLGSLTNGDPLTDSLVVLDQDAMFYATGFVASPAPRNILKLPATMTTTPWQNNYFYKVKAVFNYMFYGYVSDTLERRRYVVDNYSVIGHGRMKVRHHTQPQPWSMYDSVLQVRAAFIQVKDSFFINNVPATPTELGYFGLAQGVQTMVYRDYFYRTGEVVPWVEVRYTDASRNVVEEAAAGRSLIHTDNTVLSVGEQLMNKNSYAVYPNPVKGGNVINIDIKESTANGKWEYSLINIMGQPVAEGSMNINSGKTSINVPKVAPGIYYIQASNGDQKIVKAMDIE